jgi:NAD(P)-dependent dehydrogenase (short-subunit alcohol dehydrogenase family)
MASKNLFDLTGRVALVTGANSGLGFGFATGIAKCGGDVVVWGRRHDANVAAAERLAAYGGRVHHRSVDISDETAVRAGFADAIETMGRIDCAVANAGMFPTMERYHEMPAESWHGLLAVSLHGTHYTMQEAIRHFLARKEQGDASGGSILVCGSLATKYGVPRIENYAAAKGALGPVVRCIAAEYGGDGIRANVVLPGFVRTQGATKETEADSPMTKTLAERCPIPGWGYPEDFEGIAAYLMSDAARYHTGDLITIDGGWTSSVL